MAVLEIPVIIETDFLILQKAQFKKYFDDDDQPRVELNYGTVQLLSVPVRKGTVTLLVCSNRTRRQIGTDKSVVRMSLRIRHHAVNLEVRLTTHRPHFTAGEHEADWLDGREPYVILNKEKGLLLAGIPVRVKAAGRLCLVLDSELALAAGIDGDKKVRLHYKEKAPVATDREVKPEKRLITENDIRTAWRERRTIRIMPGQLITPAARSLGNQLKVLE